MKVSLYITIVAFLTTLGFRASAETGIDYFESAIRPLFAEKCHQCHGESHQEAGIRFDVRTTFHGTGVESPFYGDRNLFLEAINRLAASETVSEHILSDDDIAKLSHWAELGMPWPETAPVELSPMEQRIRDAKAHHWAFQPVENPAPPAVSDASKVLSDIDRFVQSRLEQAGLTPSERADRRTLIRRAAYGLTGLPPTTDEVEAFVNDTEPGAFERVVDRLLASPAYGERWARHWLDIARYADTKGYVFQEDRFYAYSHTYRDYVIEAFNDDLPYDRFIVEQLAADRLDLGDDKGPLAAMGYLTLGRRYLNNVHDIIDDRIDVVTRGMMGLTVSCARCHEHKYDPIPAEDYYALYGVFRSSHEPGELPLIEEPDPNDPQYQEFKTDLERLQGDLRSYRDDLQTAFLGHARDRVEDYFAAVVDLGGDASDESIRRLAKERELHWQPLQRWQKFLEQKKDGHDPIFAPWTALIGLDGDAFGAEIAGLAERFAKNEDANAPLNPRIARIFEGEPPASKHDVARRYAAVFDDVNRAWLNELAAYAARTAAGRTDSMPERLDDEHAEALRQVLYGEDSPARVSEQDIDQLASIPERDRMTRMRMAIQRHEATHPGRPARAMILADNDKPFDPYVFERGKPGSRGADVPRRAPVILAEDEPAPFSDGSGRLELARTIASRDNPLTARVFVNRVWMHHFGKPLVATTSDFGLRSEPPTHPELLDYLAWQFMEDGWSVKNLHRRILLSHTYQQSSVNRERFAEANPENALLWRQNRQRLDFEALRDSLLAAAGTLDRTVGGYAVDITRAPYPARRTVYALIERQNLPGVFRTFDFASPDTHSPQRFNTTVPQQALYLMNSPFALQQARQLAKRIDGDDDSERIARLYEILFQREPADREREAGLAFIRKQNELGPPPPALPPVWQYGYGRLNVDAGVLESFTVLPSYKDGSWRGGEEMPDEALGWVSLHGRGGHPGNAPDVSAIRRWTAPYDATVAIEGVIKHPQDKGDGVVGYVVSRSGVLGAFTAFNGSSPTNVDEIEVKRGEAVDFVTTCNTNTSYDSFEWRVKVEVLKAEERGKRLFDSSADFTGPRPAPPEPLQPWEAYAHTLLLTNEFAFVD